MAFDAPNVADVRWMEAALALSERGRGRTGLNPNVGCLIVQQGKVVGRGVTGIGGRPHAEALALDQAKKAAQGATAYVTLEPCAHTSPRGPMCAQALVEAGVARVVVATEDPDPRTAGKGIAMLRAAGITVIEGVLRADAQRVMVGYFSQRLHNRPHVTLKLALSLDGCIARADGESQWITGVRARAHGHLERARADMILVGGETLRADRPQLTVRLVGLEECSPQRAVLTRKRRAPEGWRRLASPHDVFSLPQLSLLIEGGAQTAAAFLKDDLVDRLLLYRAPILIGAGRHGLTDIGLTRLADAHGRWQLVSSRQLGDDSLQEFQRTRT